jgi:hypothetical protein
MNAEDMSKLFDIDVDDALETADSSDYDVTAADTSSSTFEDRVEDVKTIMEPDPDPDPDPDPGPEPEPEPEPKDDTEDDTENDLIVDAMQRSQEDTPAKSDPSPDIFDEDDANEMEIPGDVDVEKQVEQDIEDFQKELKQETEPETDKPEDAEDSPESELENSADTNPLGLSGSDLTAYKQIGQRFKQFDLYDGNPAFKDFYRSKLSVLKSMLKTFGVLDLDDLFEELAGVKLNFFVGENQIATPDLIRVRLDESYRARVRVSELLIKALAQYPAWERYSDMLRGKLWKDHDLRGAHKRDGITMEHMADIEGYVAKLHGFIEQAKHEDNMLRAAADSLSRQLTCLQLKEPTGFDQRMDAKVKSQAAPSQDSTKLEGLDTIDDGSVIEAPVSKREASPVDYGVPSDDLAELG